MATSGSIDFSLTAREVITYALRKINIVSETEEPTDDQAARAMTELNVMLKGWQKYENLWRLTEGAVTLVAATATYTLSPFPYRVISARYRDANSRDLPMNEMLRAEYYDLPLKTSAGIPTNYYLDQQRASTTMTTWPVLATVTTETIRYTYQRKFEDVDALDNDLDVKQEHFEVVGYNLAARMADDYGRTGEHINRIIARAGMLLEDILDDDREDYIQIVPGRS
jgi:hypothetical protein